MELITRITLTMGVQRCSDILQRISQKFSTVTDRERFIAAYQRYDAYTVNDLIEDELCRSLGTDNLHQGLEQYCQKFGLDVNRLSRQSNIDYIIFIDEHRDEIDRQLKTKGV